jgi:L-ribulokinase
MSRLQDKVYIPNADHVQRYDRLFKEYKILHDYFGKGENDVMKRLKSIKSDAMRSK